MESTTSLYTNFHEKIKQTHIVKCLISNSIIKSNINNKKHLLKFPHTKKQQYVHGSPQLIATKKKSKVVFQTGWVLARHHHSAIFGPMESPAAPENLLMVTWGAFQMDKNPSSKKSNLQLGYVGQGNTKTVTKVYSPFLILL